MSAEVEQLAAVAPAEAFRVVHADGVEHEAADMETVIKLCSHIGELARESYERAELAVQAATIGSTMTHESPFDDIVARTLAKYTAKEPTKSPEVATPPPTPAIEYTAALEPKIEEAIIVSLHSSAIEPAVNLYERVVAQEQVLHDLQIVTPETVENVHPVVSESTIVPDVIIKPTIIKAAPSISREVPLVTPTVIVRRNTKATPVATVVESLAAPVEVPAAEPSELTAVSVTPEYDAEIVEAITLEPQETTPEVTFDFAQYIEAYAVEQTEPQPIEILLEQAPEQPLEQTFAQIAHYFEREPEPANNEKAVTIIATLQRIEALLPKPQEIGAEVSLELSDELIEQIVILLEAIGYSKPQEKLTEFINTHDTTALVEMLRQVAQRGNYQVHDEFMTAPMIQLPATDDHRLRPLLGKLLFKLVPHVALVPAR